MGNKYNRYIVNKTVLVLSAIFASLFFLLFVIMVVILNVNSREKLGIATFNTLSIIKDVSIIGLTIFGSSILNTTLLDKNSRNSEYFSESVNEIICDPRFSDALAEDNRKRIISNAFKCKHPRQYEIMENVINKIKKSDYYYECCSMTISCSISKDSATKKIIKNIKIKSFEDDFIIDNFTVISSATKQTDRKYLNVLSISVNDKKYTENIDYSIKESDIGLNERVLLKNGYKKRFSCCFSKPLKLSSSKDTDITVEYVTNVKDDPYFTNRLSGPCKKYSLAFSISDTKNSKYEILGSAFGFMEAAEKTPNIDENQIKFEINSWSFKDDGVSLMYRKKGNKK